MLPRIMVDYKYENGIRSKLLKGVYSNLTYPNYFARGISNIFSSEKMSIYSNLVYSSVSSPIPLIKSIEELIGKEVIVLSLVNNREAYLPLDNLTKCRFQKGILEGIHHFGFMHLNMKGHNMFSTKTDVSAIYDVLLPDDVKLSDKSRNDLRRFKFHPYHDKNHPGMHADATDPVTGYLSIASQFPVDHLLMLENVEDL